MERDKCVYKLITMSNVKNTAQLPNGTVLAVPLSGVVASTTGILAAGQTWETEIIPYNGRDSVLFVLSSDVQGTYTVEWYNGQQKIDFMGNATTYNPNATPAFQVGIQVKANGVKFKYVNGDTPQTRFYGEVRLSPNLLQESLRSVGSPTSSTNLAGTVHSVIEGREDGTGSYAQATVTILEDGKVAQDVNVIGGINATIDSTTPINVNVANSTPITVKGKVELDGIANLATAAKQDVNHTDLQAILTRLGQQLTVNTTDISTLATQATAAQILTALNSILTKLASGVEIDNSTGNALSVTHITGYSTEATLLLAKNLLNDIYTKLSASIAITASSLPLPTGASTSALQTDLNTAIGTKADPIVTDATQSASLISIMKGLLQEGLAQPSTGTAQTVSLAANVAQTIPANNNGKGRLIFSVSGTIFIGFGFTATASLYSVRIITNGFYEVPPLWSNLSISLFATASSTVNVTTLA